MAKLTKALKENRAKTYAAAKDKQAQAKIVAKQTRRVETKPASVETKRPISETKPPENGAAAVNVETKSGRRRGAKTGTPQVESGKSRCPKCNSTTRKPYANTRAVESPGMINGKPYTHVVFRYTNCKKCGQARVDRTCENR
jgi:hypothetical protein